MKKTAYTALCLLLLLATLLYGCRQKEMASNAQIVWLKSEHQKHSTALNEIKVILEEKGYMNDPAYYLDISRAAEELNRIIMKLPSGSEARLKDLEEYYAMLGEIAAVTDAYRSKAEASQMSHTILF